MSTVVALNCHFLDDDLRKIVRDTFDTNCVFPAFPSNAQGSSVRCLVNAFGTAVCRCALHDSACADCLFG